MVRCKEQTVDLSLQVDHRAMEPNEEFTLSLVRQGTIDAIIVNEIDITIIDSDGKYMVPKIVVHRTHTYVI